MSAFLRLGVHLFYIPHCPSPLFTGVPGPKLCRMWHVLKTKFTVKQYAKGQQDVSVEEVLATKSKELSSLPRTPW